MKKRALSLLMAFVMVLSLLPATARAAETGPQGSGTADEPYLIGTAEELKWFRDLVNGSTDAENHRHVCAKLTADIDLKGDEWNPIGGNDGYATSYYAGQFDGNGKRISNFKITAKYNYAGFFSYVKDNAYIHDLKISKASISSEKNNAGGIIGTMIDGTVEKCSFDGEVKGLNTSRGYAGGIVGYLGNTGKTSPKITNCANFGSISAGYAGGITGYAKHAKEISNCYNTGRVNGSTRSGGIVGQNMYGTKITNCFNTGAIEGTGIGAIAGFAGVKITNCYWTQPAVGKGGGAGTINEDGEVDSIASVAGQLGSAFRVVDGEVVLAWEAGGTPAEKNPRIVISGGSTLQMTNSVERPHTTLTVAYKDMDETPAVTWTADNACVTLETPNNATETNHTVIVHAVKPGTVKITAVAGEYTAEFTMSIVPQVTTVEIKNVNQPGAVAVGQTVQAQVNILGGGEYDYENYPKLTYQWYRYNVRAGKSEEISGATSRTFEIKAKQFDGEDQKYKIGVDVACNGETVHSYNDDQQSVRSAEYGKAYVVAQDIALLTDITEETVLTLPAVHTKDGETVNIEWSSKDIAITDNTVKLTLPESGKKTIKLSAKCTLADTNTAAYRTFTVYVWSTSGADENTLNEAASKLKNMGVLYPRFGKDSNVQTMVETRLANAGFSGVGVKFISAEPTNATADQAASAISSIGGITYFYDDPNKTVNERTQWFDTYKAYFTLTCGSETQENVAVPVTVYWDVNKVCRVMTEEVLDRVTLPELTEGNLNLPTAVEGKQWTKIVWTSSDPGIISNGGVVTRSAIDRQTVLTAGFTFQRTNDVTGSEPSIVLYKVFEVTVKGNADAADRAALYQQKLNDALAAPGLKDFVTGEKLTADANGVYTTSNDIQFPTTRDLKIDGKYTPVVITSSDPGVIEAPTTPNSARVWVYRPLPGESAKTVTLTMKILDRPNGPQPGDDLSAMRVLASKEIKVTVQPLTQDEIDAEIALMERVKVKVNYWNGIRNANVERDNVTTDLHAFQECYLNDNGELTWVYDREDLKNHGIVPVPLDNWYDQQIWRLFRSSNAGVVAHENLLVTRQGDSKAVTITSYLSSETLGKYAEKYPQNADFQKLYKQPVTIDLVVTGTQYAQGNNEGRVQAAKRALAVRPTVTVSFSLSGRGMGFTESNLEYAEGSTVYDVFSDLLAEHRYTCKRRGSYIAAITSNSGVTLEEFDEGKNSGWMYRVNGELVGRYMSAQGLNDGDRIELYFTSDWTSEPGAEGWQKPDRIETIVNADGSVTKIETKSDGTVIETTTWRDGSTLTAETSPNGRVETVEKRADGTTVETVESASGGITASVSVPKSVGSTRVDIPVSKPTGSMVAVIVHPDGTEEIVRGSVVTETGVALRAEGNVQLKIIDNAKRFNDMADHWAKDAVEFASSRELFNGVGNDAFGPDRSMTRGMVGTVLARLAGADTAGGETWYAKGTAWAVENGISDGTAPEQPVTREQLAAMLYRYAGSPAVSGELGFDDADSISAWARDAVRWCVDNGILNGVGGNRMTPQDLARRGQVAAMLMRFLQATV